MVTSNKLPDKKVVKMAEHNNSSVIPQRTLLGEVNEHITCPLCRGYYIDATTIVECLHSFCRSCIIKHLQVKSYCPVCEMMINSAKPNIKLDKALQDIVYKLVPGLFQKEMERRQQFYASHPGQAASATPEQRGEDTERIIFSPEDVISFSLEYADATDTDSISSKSSDSNEPQPPSAVTRRYLQCPAVVNISHLKKFLSMKFDIDSTQFAIDILYKRVPLPDYYTLMDIAYIYNWKRNEPMRFFYQIIDYVAIRNRLFDINRKGSHYEDRKSSPAPTEDTNVSSPAANLNEPGSEASSGTDSPMPDDDNIKKVSDISKKNEGSYQQIKNSNTQDNLDLNKSNCPSPLKKPDDEVEKSQFLNSFELTAKNHNNSLKSSPVKSSTIENVSTEDTTPKIQNNSPKTEDILKRKYQTPPNTPEIKKLKIELEKTKISNNSHSSVGNNNNETLTVSNQGRKASETSSKISEIESNKSSQSINKISTSSVPMKDSKQEPNILKHQAPESPSVKESPGVKRNVCGTQSISSPKRKPIDSTSSTSCLLTGQKSITPIKPLVPKLEAQPSSKLPDTQKPLKKMPDLKPSVPPLQTSQSKTPFNKVRMDLLANNSDPTIDRSKILSQVKSSLSNPSTTQASGDPLKSLFDSCKINIPSSLSITLTDQKLDTRNAGDSTSLEQKKAVLNKNLTAATNVVTHKVPSPPVHNYIEILKLPEGDPKKQQKIESNPDVKTNTSIKSDAGSIQSKPSNKPPETSSKGPVPNLKPISDTKLAKQSGNISAPITFQQTFEQQLQSMQSDKKSKLPKTKAQVPKLVPATPKAFNAVNKMNSNNKSSMSTVSSIENKTGAALDLSTPHNVQSQLGPQQTKAFETMQSIANLAKKQNLPSKGLPTSMMQSNVYSSVASRPQGTGINQLRVPSTSTINQLNLDKSNPSGSQSSSPRQEMGNKVNPPKQTNSCPVTPPSYHISNAPNMAQPSPRSQTRSPSSSPKLVIAEDKQVGNSLESSINQSNQISSTQLPNLGAPKSESPKPSPGPSKPTIKTMKPVTPSGKITGIRQPITPTIKPNPVMNPPDYLLQPQLITAQHALLRQQMEMQMQMFKAHRQYDLFKMSNMSHQAQNEFNNKDKH